MNKTKKIALAIVLMGATVFVAKPSEYYNAAECQQVKAQFASIKQQLDNWMTGIRANMAQRGINIPVIQTEPWSKPEEIQWYLQNDGNFRDWYGKIYIPFRMVYLERMYAGVCEAPTAEKKSKKPLRSGRRYTKSGKRAPVRAARQ